MGITELFLVGVGLSMDAFAVAICRGLSMKKLEWKQALLVAVFFGGFQALMPTIGWVLGKQFEQYIVSVDHWIAFILLAYIGGKMIWDAFHEEEAQPADFRVGELLIMAVAPASTPWRWVSPSPSSRWTSAPPPPSSAAPPSSSLWPGCGSATASAAGTRARPPSPAG